MKKVLSKSNVKRAQNLFSVSLYEFSFEPFMVESVSKCNCKPPSTKSTASKCPGITVSPSPGGTVRRTGNKC